MTLTLYKNKSEYNAIDKDLETLLTLSGILREESSIIDPVILVEDLDDIITDINYAYISEFGRYYFINNITSVRQGLWRIMCHVDVLYTYRAGIRANNAIIERNELEYDLKLNDGLFRTQQNPRIAQYAFPLGFNTWNFVLAIAGN